MTRLENETVSEAAERAAGGEAGLSVCAAETVLGTVRHGVTTRKITLHGVACTLCAGEGEPSPPDGRAWRWVDTHAAALLALSSPQVRLLEEVEKTLRQAEAQPALF